MPGPDALYAVLLKKFNSNKIRKVETVVKFFKQVIDENADRAERGEAPLDYKECGQAWVDIPDELDNNENIPSPAPARQASSAPPDMMQRTMMQMASYMANLNTHNNRGKKRRVPSQFDRNSNSKNKTLT